MSRVAKEKVCLNGVSCEKFDEFLILSNVAGKKLKIGLFGLGVSILDGIISVNLTQKSNKSLAGTVIRNIRNAVNGLSKGVDIAIEMNGVGYKADLIGDKYLSLYIGLSHGVLVVIPSDISVKVTSSTKIFLSSFNLNLVTAFAAYLKSMKKVEPYKAKGIIEVGDFVRRKEVKANKK